MLPERLTQLLTAYIDGELSSRQRKAVTRLLRKSPEARKLLQEMKQDSMILRRLPRKKMKQDLSQTLPGTIDMRGLKLPMPRPAAPPATRVKLPVAVAVGVPTWMVVVVAALVLCAVGFGSYLFFSSAGAKPGTPKAEPTSPAP
jgi:anti-sigma factor RsiW